MNEILKQNSDGTIINVKIIANASANKIELEQTTLKIRVKAPAVDNKANSELIKFLSKHLNISKSNIEILKGEKSTHKTILVRTRFYTTPEEIISQEC